MTMRVWAPAAKSVDLVLPDRKIAMQAGDQGYWSADVDAPSLRGGYRYAIDGGATLPDPRSRWQPDGVHGNSYVVDIDELRRIQGKPFQPKPLREALIYELHVGTFTAEGTYTGAERHLQHLADLGVTHVELLPLATFPGAHGWGYDGVDLYAPLPAYGTPQDLARFIRACHDLGLAVLLDVVYNHIGPDGNYLSQFGPYFTDRVKTPWGEAINYDGPGSDAVRRFVIDNALMWLEDYGFDGLRLDAVHAIYSFEAVHVLEELADDVRVLGERLDRSFVLIAESDLNDPRLVRESAVGGFGLDAHWTDDFHHALHRFFTGEHEGYYVDFRGLEDIAVALEQGYVYQGQYSAHRQRRHGRPAEGVSADQLVIYSQNHDQIGNRARGERLSMLLELPQLKAIAALTLLSPYVPMLFQGEEWGATTPFLYFTDHQDPELGKLVAEGRSKEFSAFAWSGDVPNPQARDTYERSKLDWSELHSPEHADLLEWYRRLIAIRRVRSAKFGGAMAHVEYDPAAQWFRFRVKDTLAVFNFSSQPQRVPMPAGDWDLALSSDAEETDGTGAGGRGAGGQGAGHRELAGFGTRVFILRSR
jgi:maltooligosyltrehalose trehalohydrolase